MAVLRCLRNLGIGTNFPLERILHCREQSTLDPNDGEVTTYRNRLNMVSESLGKVRTEDYEFFVQFRELLTYLFSNTSDYLSNQADNFGQAKFKHTTLKWEIEANSEGAATVQDLWSETSLPRPQIIANSILVKLDSRFREFVGQELRGKLLAVAEATSVDGWSELLHPKFFSLTYNKQIAFALELAEEHGLLQNPRTFETSRLNINPTRIATACLNVPKDNYKFSLYCNGLSSTSDFGPQISATEELKVRKVFRGQLRWRRNILEHSHNIEHKQALKILLDKTSSKSSVKELREEHLAKIAQEFINDDLEVLIDMMKQILISPTERFSGIHERYFKGDFDSQEESWMSLCEWRADFGSWENALSAVSNWLSTDISLFEALRWDRYGCSPSNADIAFHAGFLPCETPESIAGAGISVTEESLNSWHPLSTRDILGAVSLGFANAKEFLDTRGNGLSKTEIVSFSDVSGGRVPAYLLHRFRDFISSGIGLEMAIQLSLIEHISTPQAIELSTVDKPLQVIVEWASQVRTHSIRMKWLTSHGEIDLALGLIYAKNGITIAAYKKMLQRRTGD
jgi:hypothetical protein